MINDYQLGRVGLWSMELRGDRQASAAAAAEIEALGFGAVWIPGGIDSDVLDDTASLLAATQRMTIATGILNIWMHKPADVAAWYRGLPTAQQQRVLLGLGVSHSLIIGEKWQKPLSLMRKYLDDLEAAGMPKEKLCLAALGPKMLELSRDRTLGAHPYLVNPEHAKQARSILGADALLAPEQGVVLEQNLAKARNAARQALSIYLQLPNYCNNWLRMGFTQEDLDSASDRLIDGLFACGSAQAIAQRVEAYFAAGADHVCLQVINSQPEDNSMQTYLSTCKQLASALL